MRVYLDNCCYNRPFDDQRQASVQIETEAKKEIQRQMRAGSVEYVWSFMLSMEVARNPNLLCKFAISLWKDGAVFNVMPSVEIRIRAREIEAMGIKSADAIHLARAESADCDWFFTTDKGILKKIRSLGMMRVANPVEYFIEG